MLSTTQDTSRTQAITLASGKRRTMAGIQAHQARLVLEDDLGGESAQKLSKRPCRIRSRLVSSMKTENSLRALISVSSAPKRPAAGPTSRP